MKTIEVNLAQERVENTFGDKVTEFYVVADSDDKVAYIVSGDEVREWTGYGMRRQIKILVSHPAIMAGDWAEVKQDIVREIEAALLKNNLCEENEAGVLFVK